MKDGVLPPHEMFVWQYERVKRRISAPEKEEYLEFNENTEDVAILNDGEVVDRDENINPRAKYVCSCGWSSLSSKKAWEHYKKYCMKPGEESG